jgi:hypothetical protein
MDGRPAAQHRVAAVPAAAPAGAEPAQPEAAHAAATAALKDRVQSLEKALEEMHQQLAVENAKIQDLKQMAPPAAAPPSTTGDSPVQVELMRAREYPAPVLAAIAPTPVQPAIGKGMLGSLAIALALLLAGLTYLRRRVLAAGAASTPALPAEKPLPTSAIPHRDAAQQLPESTTEAQGTPVSRVQERPPLAAADAIIAREILPRTANNDIDESIGIDTVALERSYLESLGVDSLGIDATAPHRAVDDTAPADTATHDTADMNTEAVDTSGLDTAVIKSDLNTAILDTKKFDPSAVNGTALDYNLLDLDATTEHVHMPSDLLDEPDVKDRRTNIVDVLKMAIDRDPQRRDLRMKLLETYYGAASMNQRGFLEIVRKLSREPDFLSPDDWQKVVMMGRAIAPDDILFAEQPKDDDLANCA